MSYITDSFKPRFTVSNTVQSEQQSLLRTDQARESRKYNIVFDSFNMTVNPVTWNPNTGAVAIPILGGWPWDYSVDLTTLPNWSQRESAYIRVRKVQIVIANNVANYGTLNPFLNYIFSMKIPVDNRYEFRTADQRWVASDVVDFAGAQFKQTKQNTVDYGGYGQWANVGTFAYWHVYEFDTVDPEAKIYIPGNMQSTRLQFLKGDPSDFVFVGAQTGYTLMGKPANIAGENVLLNTVVDLEFGFFD